MRVNSQTANDEASKKSRELSLVATIAGNINDR